MPANSFEYFLGRRNRAVVDLLEQNEDVNGFIAALLEHLTEYAREQGIPLKAVRMDRPYVTADGRLVAQISRAPR